MDSRSFKNLKKMTNPEGFLWIITSLFFSGGFAFGGGRPNLPTFFINATAEYATYKSELLESNDIGTGIEYALGVHAGSENQIAAILSQRTEAVSYALNEASYASSEQSFVFRYYLGVFYLGVGIGSSKSTYKTANSTEVVLEQRNFLGQLGFIWAVFRDGELFADIMAVSPSDTSGENFENSSLEMKTTGHLGTTFKITRRSLRFSFGIRYASRSGTIEGVTGSEVVTTPIVGFTYGVDI